jgi:hypothetical protein
MKKSAKIRLALHRETLRALTSPELQGVEGAVAQITGTNSITCFVSCGGTCHVPCTVTGTA